MSRVFVVVLVVLGCAGVLPDGVVSGSCLWSYEFGSAGAPFLSNWVLGYGVNGGAFIDASRTPGGNSQSDIRWNFASSVYIISVGIQGSWRNAISQDGTVGPYVVYTGGAINGNSTGAAGSYASTRGFSLNRTFLAGQMLNVGVSAWGSGGGSDFGSARIERVVIDGTGPNPWGPDCPPTVTPTPTVMPTPSATPLLVWLPTTDLRPVCTGTPDDRQRAETAIAPTAWPTFLVPTAVTAVAQVPTISIPEPWLPTPAPGSPSWTPSPTKTLTPVPTATILGGLHTVTPGPTRTPTATLVCKVPDTLVPIVDVGGLTPERDAQCFSVLPLIDWHIEPINLVVFTTPAIDVHIPEIQLCITWLPIRLTLMGMDFTGVLGIGLALLGVRFLMGFRREI